MATDDRLHLFGVYTLDLARGILLAGSEPVHLRPQAYALLRYLAANRGRLIAKDELVERIWQGRAVGDDSLVQGLRDVRHALGPDSATYIRTVRGRGYIFDPPTTAASAPGREGWKFGRGAAALLVLGVVLAAGATAYQMLDVRGGSRTRTDASTLPAGYSPDHDAHLLYLRGRHQQQQTTEAGLRSAIDLYSKAIAADPKHAGAHAALAGSYRALAIVANVPSRDAMPLARQSALKALALDDRLVEAHVALGWILFSYDWKWTEAEASLKRAIELDPRSAEAHKAYAHLLSNMGRHGEAIFEAARARELDPRDLLTRALEAQFLFYGGRYDEAETRLRATLEMEPDYWVAHLGLGRVFMLRDQFPEAIASLRKATALSKSALEATTQLAYALGRSGHEPEARRLLGELETRSRSSYVPAYTFAMIRNGLHDRDAALEQLERSVAGREIQATFIRIDTRWDWIRADPRFATLLQQVNLK